MRGRRIYDEPPVEHVDAIPFWIILVGAMCIFITGFSIGVLICVSGSASRLLNLVF